MAEDKPRLKKANALTLAAVMTAVGCSRLFARYTLRNWDLDVLRDDAELVISELVTNAVKTTGVTEAQPRWTELDDLALIDVRLVLTDISVIIEVWDRDPRPPIIKQPRLDDENGRGLFIIGELCRRWNFYPARKGGKVVWGELEIPPFQWTDAGLPKRPQPSGPRPQPQVTHDRELLQRVHDGLQQL